MHLQDDDMGAGLAPAPSVCAICGEPFVAGDGRAKYAGRLTRACDQCRKASYDLWNAKALAKRKTKSKKGKPALGECARCGDAFAYLYRQRARTVCDPCRMFDFEWSKYRLNHREVAEIRQQQRCTICGSRRPGGRFAEFHIDHDHATGKVRGLLCAPCNTAIGSMRDDPERLRAAAEYLES